MRLLAVSLSFVFVTAYSNFRRSINSRSIFKDAAYRSHDPTRQGEIGRTRILARTISKSDDDTKFAPTPPTHAPGDIQYMNLATSFARIGYGNTFPNPAVGCVLVRHRDCDGDVVVGSGFHPRSGMPHAEVFALLEACGHVEDGVASARAVMEAKGEGTSWEEGTKGAGCGISAAIGAVAVPPPDAEGDGAGLD